MKQLIIHVAPYPSINNRLMTIVMDITRNQTCYKVVTYSSKPIDISIYVEENSIHCVTVFEIDINYNRIQQLTSIQIEKA